MFCHLFLYATGSAPPLVPVYVIVTNITSFSAEIHWTVPYLAYTPESYKIVYGINPQNLELYPEYINSPSTALSVNLSYSLTLQPLSPYQRYYFQILSANTIDSVATDVKMFRTLETGV